MALWCQEEREPRKASRAVFRAPIVVPRRAGGGQRCHLPEQGFSSPWILCVATALGLSELGQTAGCEWGGWREPAIWSRMTGLGSHSSTDGPAYVQTQPEAKARIISLAISCFQTRLLKNVGTR